MAYINPDIFPHKYYDVQATKLEEDRGFLAINRKITKEFAWVRENCLSKLNTNLAKLI